MSWIENKLRELERIVDGLKADVQSLRSATSKIPVRQKSGGGGGGGMTIGTYTQFPEIPATPTIIFMNVGSEHALWCAGPGMDKWDPMHHYTSLTGEPGTPE